MKVIELIKKLQEFDPMLDVVYEGAFPNEDSLALFVVETIEIDTTPLGPRLIINKGLL